MVPSVLTPLQLIAGQGLLQNQGITASPELTSAATAYLSTPLISAFTQALALDSTLSTLCANSVPAFSNSLPVAYANLGVQMTTVMSAQSVYDAGSGDISKFIQALNLALSYGQITNQFINSAVNSQTYLGNTFTTTNDMITGDLTTVNLATQAFGNDLSKLGTLIDLDNLGNLGSPAALLQRIVQVAGTIPVLAVYLLAEGIAQEIVLNLGSATISVTDAIQRAMYQAMTKVINQDLAQVLKVLKVTTVGINTMADLLNPVKIFPNSYQSLTVTTANGLRAIYLNNAGTVNSTLANELPAYVVSTTA